MRVRRCCSSSACGSLCRAPRNGPASAALAAATRTTDAAIAHLVATTACRNARREVQQKTAVAPRKRARPGIWEARSPTAVVRRRNRRALGAGPHRRRPRRAVAIRVRPTSRCLHREAGPQRARRPRRNPRAVRSASSSWTWTIKRECSRAGARPPFTSTAQSPAHDLTAARACAARCRSSRRCSAARARARAGCGRCAGPSRARKP